MHPNDHYTTHFASVVDKNPEAPLQVCLAGTGILGPGIVRRVTSDNPEVYIEDVYVMDVQVQHGQGPGAQILEQPMTFSAHQIVWFSTGPKRAERPLVVPAGGGGLVVPRG